MGKTPIAQITNQLKALNKGIEELKSGNLKTEDLNGLTENAREIFEKLVVIRHKAFEKMNGKPAAEEKIIPVTSEKPEEKSTIIKEEESIAFDFSESTPKDSSTDTIFDFSGQVATTAERENETESHITMPVEEEKDVAVEEENIEEEVAVQDDSLNSMFADTRDGSLRKQLGRTAIEDLRSEIGIAKKFEYINSLFSGKAEIYDSAIDQLNTCENEDSAKTLLHTYAQEYSWNLEDKSTLKFIELVERRYL